ncbi:MAG: exodeoxyribonuclease VII large subunit [Xanthomonadales bacterium]|nr:exodeoxyribonuclease VII large subunit [Xanthomonadales bacterium]
MRNVYSPSELNREAKIHLEAGFGRVWVEGEISNLSRPASGHLYFTLKDDKAQLRCALFRGNARGLSVAPANGQQVRVRGRLSLYEVRGDYQLIADSMEAAGEGRLRAAFEALKRQLEQEGLFAADQRRALPRMPAKVGIITSPSGAVIRDMLQVLARRWPLAAVRLYPVPVQGTEAAPAIVKALEAATAQNWAEVLILARGGGSLEDLWPFNEEAVARAIHRCTLPIVSAVGHETDTSISDFVADLRAPTPSAAAELITPDRAVLARAFESTLTTLGHRAGADLQRRNQQLDELSGRLNRQQPERRLVQRRQQLTALEKRLEIAARRRLREPVRQLPLLHKRLHSSLQHALPARQQRLAALARTLHAVSPLPTLERGYTLTTLADSDKALRSVEQLAPGTRIETRLLDGSVDSEVVAVHAERLQASEP